MNTNQNELALVVMAAGAARRYGGLKQLAPAGPRGEAVMEYSIHDALAAGFSQVVLVIRREFEPLFREKFVDRASSTAPITFVYQDIENSVPHRWRGIRRDKPWGTAHAVLCAGQKIDRAFAVINADDYYGPTALAQMAQYLATISPDRPLPAAMVGYELRHTLSTSGTVSRGVCEHDANGLLLRIVERHGIANRGDGGEFSDAQGKAQFLPGDTTVSMNLWGYPREMFDHLEQRFTNFLDGPREESQEFELPTTTQRLIDERLMTVRVLKTNERWCGMTYQEDLPIVQQRLASLVNSGVYPSQLW
ncbi:MAG: NTP transferase domain-containing protein [Pirellulales bacterium]